LLFPKTVIKHDDEQKNDAQTQDDKKGALPFNLSKQVSTLVLWRGWRAAQKGKGYKAHQPRWKRGYHTPALSDVPKVSNGSVVEKFQKILSGKPYSIAAESKTMKRACKAISIAR
jgi:hypothetical protein